MSYYVRLFTNKTLWKSHNEIEELDCAGYAPYMTTKNMIMTSEIPFVLDEGATVTGCYITTTEGDIAFTQWFPEPFTIKPQESVRIKFYN